MDDKTSVYIGGASFSGLLGEINKSMRTPELLKRWSRVMPDGGVLKVISWAWSEKFDRENPVALGARQRR